MDAESIRIETDEDGFHLDITVSEDDWSWIEGSTVRLRVTDPEALYDHVKAVIGPWLYEREQASAEFRQAVRSGSGPAAAFVCRDVDESDGYDESDPKHPDWYSIHVDHYDMREKAGES
jgi:hypothetical protein